MFVYVIAMRDFVKIGVAKDVRARMRDLQVAAPIRLRLVTYFPGARGTERALHTRFAAYCSQGEWFQIRGEVAEWVIALMSAGGAPITRYEALRAAGFRVTEPSGDVARRAVGPAMVCHASPPPPRPPGAASAWEPGPARSTGIVALEAKRLGASLRRAQ